MTSTLVLEPTPTPSGRAFVGGPDRQGNVYITPWRPWLTMYGLRLRNKAQEQVIGCIGFILSPAVPMPSKDMSGGDA